IRIVTEKAWQNLFAHHLFIKPDRAHVSNHQPEFTVISAPNFQADPERDGTASETFIIVNFLEKLVLIGGTHYAGEIKKSIFGVLNYLLPLKGVLSMHASANIGKDGTTAVFFGLSGTGKTTLSVDPERILIGDDEHGWSDRGVFNFEGGCYAKMIKLSKEAEPEIFATTQRFGTILENVVMDPHSRELDLNDETLTENTRGGYPLEFIPNASTSGVGGHPRDIVMLTADAFGVLPPISKLSTEQAMYHFLSGYTAKVAGTERGVTEPQATFSTCFGAPFMVLDPSVYAKLLGEKIVKHKTRVWLLNTGWSGGPYGVGHRMKIAHTRAMLHAALDGKLDDVTFQKEPFFNLQIPTACPGVPAEVLDPRKTWKDTAGYDKKAKDLAGRFIANFKQFEAKSTAEILVAGPTA
ncbi:MAG: phosphoenolpyruvate carboxykinase (ATP), partial [Candidatus Wallbacteria bacterium]|nr:phosphoenolpyruvate carboxykinase (ATP) [Candidatus Wallbacteria bacterium]